MIIPKKCYINIFSNDSLKTTDSLAFLEYMGFKSIVENTQDTYWAELPEDWKAIQQYGTNWHTVYDTQNVVRFTFFMNQHLSKMHIEFPQPSFAFDLTDNMHDRADLFLRNTFPDIADDFRNRAVAWFKETFNLSLNEDKRLIYPLYITWSPEQIVAVFFEFLRIAFVDFKYIFPFINQVMLPKKPVEKDFIDLCLSYAYVYFAIQNSEDIKLIDKYFQIYDLNYQAYMKKWHPPVSVFD